MEYRGKTYTVIQDIGLNTWKWTVQLDERTVKAGDAGTRESAMTSAIWAIDKALAPRKVKLKPPADESPVESADPTSNSLFSPKATRQRREVPSFRRLARLAGLLH